MPSTVEGKCLRELWSSMSESAQDKRYISKQGRNYHWNCFGTRIPLNWITITASDGTQMSVHKYMATMTGNASNYDHCDIFLFPPLPRGIGTNVLFTLSYRGFTLDITMDDICCIERMQYWCGCEDKDMLGRLLKSNSTVFCLITTENKDSMYVTVKGKRLKPTQAPLCPLGVFDVLPKKVLDEVKKNKWRIILGDPTTAMQQVTKEPINSEQYVESRCAKLLRNIPVECYSVKTGFREKTIHVDVCKLRNLYMLFAHSITKTTGLKRACMTNLDLFDAMLASGCLWSNDCDRDVIYLPVLERPPIVPTPFIFHLATKSDHEQHGYDQSMEDLFPHLTEECQLEVLKKVFPYWQEQTGVVSELFRRLEASGSIGRFRPGQCITVNGHRLCTLPREVALM